MSGHADFDLGMGKLYMGFVRRRQNNMGFEKISLHGVAALGMGVVSRVLHLAAIASAPILNPRTLESQTKP